MPRQDLIQSIINRDQRVALLRRQIGAGNIEICEAFQLALVELLKRPEQRHVAYMEISETLNLGNTSAAHRFSLKVMPTVLQTHSSPALDEYIVLWGQMCDGSTLKRGYPNLKQQLQSLRVAGQTLPQPIQNILISFENNVANQQDTNMVFFDSLDGSVASSHLSVNNLQEVVRMDILELQHIRQRILNEDLTEENYEEFKHKGENYIALPQQAMTKELKIDYLRELEFARLLVLQEKLKKRSTKSFKRAFLTEGVMRYRDNNLCTTTYHKKSSELSATGNMFGSNHNTFNRQSSPAAPWQSNGFSNPYTFSSPNGFLSPNGFSSANGFSSPLQASSSSKRRLSQFTVQRKQVRQRKLINPTLSYPDQLTLQNYKQHFPNGKQFSNFRHSCFRKTVQLYDSEAVSITCSVSRNGNAAKLQIEYRNKQAYPLEVQGVYKILEMFKLDKLSNITRRFLLEDSQLHIFSLEVEKCPLDICLLTVKYKMNANSRRVKKPIVLPVTLHNFIEFLPVAKEEWLGMWNQSVSTVDRCRFYQIQQLELDVAVLGSNEADSLLPDSFVDLGSVEGEFVNEYGCSCFYSKLRNLSFLMRLSLRSNCIVTLSVVSRDSVDNCQRNFLAYYINVWLTLLVKLKEN